MTDALTLEEYAIRMRENTGLELVRPTIPPMTNIDLKGQFLNVLKETPFMGKITKMPTSTLIKF